MIVKLDNLEMDDYSSIKEIPIAGTSENLTLGGSMYVDYTYRRRRWELTWEVITKADFEAIRTIYNKQYTDSVLPLLTISARSITRFCHIKLPTLDLRHDDQYVYNFTLVIEELGAIS